MKIQPQTEKNISDLVKFLKEEKIPLPDKHVKRMYKERYNSTLTLFEYSHLLAVLESLSLLDKHNSINEKDTFYNDMHKSLKLMMNPVKFPTK